MKKTQRLQMLLIYAVMILISAVVLFPLLYTLLASFKSNMELMTDPGSIIPKNPTFENYVTALKSPDFNVPRLLWNSIYYTLINVLVITATSSMAGYVFARGNFPFKRTIFVCFSSLLFIKTGMLGIYATFKVLNVVNLTQSLWALIVYHIFSVPVVDIFLVKGYVQSLPIAMDEAAKIDGCSFFKTFIYIIAPLLKPIIATIAILSFKASWNEYLMPTIFTLTQPSQRTLMVGLMALKNSGEAATSWNLMLTGSVIALIPVLIAYSFGNKYFIKGLSAGAVKG
ncbi:MAG: carbohydrate ABC transporter permease [Clostridia bacterium]|nr:carbohydrate ABC transporter permease [Clostridia bacterium]